MKLNLDFTKEKEILRGIFKKTGILICRMIVESIRIINPYVIEKNVKVSGTIKMQKRLDSGKYSQLNIPYHSIITYERHGWEKIR